MDEKEFESINVIPLVDVMLVLLTIVLTTSTFIASGVIPVELPKATHSSASERQTNLTIVLDAHGQPYFNSQPITLVQLTQELRQHDKNSPILIRADKTIALQFFVEVMDTVKGLGFSKVSLQTETF